MSVAAVIEARRKILAERRRALDELGYDDLAVEAGLVEELEVLEALGSAYLDELVAERTLPRGALRAELHEGLAALERDDLAGLERAIIAIADLLGGTP